MKQITKMLALLLFPFASMPFAADAACTYGSASATSAGQYICAFNGCGNQVFNNGSTASPSMSLFEGTNGVVFMFDAKFYLNNVQVFPSFGAPLSASFSFSGLAPGTYTFTSDGLFFGPTPVDTVTFTWTIIPPGAAQIANAIAAVSALSPSVLNAGQANALIVKLTSNQFNAFNSQVNGWSGNVLNLSQAAALLASLKCP